MTVRKSITFKIKNASAEELFWHLNECNSNFSPPLSEKVNITNYAAKIFEKAVTFEAWSGKILTGMIAAYFNDAEGRIGYISNVSVIKDYEGLGIGSGLLRNCIEYAQQRKFSEIQLEVSENTSIAIRLYKNAGFVEFGRRDNCMLMKLHLYTGT